MTHQWHGKSSYVDDSWVWMPGFGSLGLTPWVWIPRVGYLGLDTWSQRLEIGPDVKIPGYGLLVSRMLG